MKRIDQAHDVKAFAYFIFTLFFSFVKPLAKSPHPVNFNEFGEQLNFRRGQQKDETRNTHHSLTRQTDF